MATTGIWKIEKRLDNVLDYTTNVEKTINSEYGKDSYYDLHNVIDYVEADYKTEKRSPRWRRGNRPARWRKALKYPCRTP